LPTGKPSIKPPGGSIPALIELIPLTWILGACPGEPLLFWLWLHRTPYLARIDPK